MTPDGLVVRSSAHGARETLDRLAAAVVARGMSVFARIDHAGAAAEVGMALRPTALLIFGAARGGTPLMQAAQTAGVDLPLKALCWEDQTGTVQLGYDAPSWIARRHGIGAEAQAALAAMTAMLEAVASEACAG